MNTIEHQVVACLIEAANVNEISHIQAFFDEKRKRLTLLLENRMVWDTNRLRRFLEDGVGKFCSVTYSKDYVEVYVNNIPDWESLLGLVRMCK
jgi:hypothetical protein